MSDIALLLGPIAFRGFEVPAVIRFGGRQRLAVHDLPGGGRIVDAMGPEEGDIGFAGVISGSDAAARALELDAIRAAGLPLPLYWDSFFYMVLVEDFTADYLNPSWIPYRINCRVMQSAVGFAVGAATTVLTAVTNDLSAAASYAAPVGIDLSAATTAVASPGATGFGTAANAAAQAQFGSAIGGIGTQAQGASAVLNSPPGPNLLGTADPVVAVQSLGSLTGAAQSLSALTLAGAYASRAATNLAGAAG